ncbi:DUF58 domain-containing protein [Bacillus sp. JCM 19034]|uniref:DUF58 domain-containing protein n=1 Tax=Bacillus sp. JCM 19034 TaxID=1481928 RepID=UPI0007803724|nr:DUF58 domain-containing protein [Bacillus sp. JCM 19034]
MRIFDELPERLRQKDTPGALFFFSFQRVLSFTYTLNRLERGVYRFGTVNYKLGDIFGLIEVERRLHAEETEVLVYPAFRNLAELPPVSHHRDREGQQTRTSFQEDCSLAGVRQYVQGDRLTSINWKQTARSSSLMTKEFESFQGEGAMIVYNSFLHKNNENVFESSIELAASMLATLLKRQSSVAFYVRTDQWQSITLTQTMITALQVLAYVKPNKERPSVAEGVYRKWRGMFVYYVCAELDYELLKVCKKLLAQHVSLTICIPSLTNSDQRVINEVEMLGIQVVEMN